MKSQTVANVHRIKDLAHKKYKFRLEAVKNFCENKRYKIPKVERNNDVNVTKRWRQEMWWDLRLVSYRSFLHFFVKKNVV